MWASRASVWRGSRGEFVVSHHYRGRNNLPLEPLEPRLLLSGSIGGTVFADLDLDSALDAGEAGLAAVTVYLDGNDNGILDWTDANSNSIWDSGEGEQWAQTDATGGYLFTGLLAGDFILRNEPIPGFNRPGPDGASAAVSLETDQDLTGVDLGNARVPDVPDLPPAFDTGISDSDNITAKGNDTVNGPLTIEVSGVQAGDLVTLYEQRDDLGVPLGPIGQATATASTVTITNVDLLSRGVNPIFASITDSYGLWGLSEPLYVDIDPVGPYILVDPLITTDPTPVITGTVSEPSTVVVTVDGNDYNAVVETDGTWSVPDGTISTLVPGSYTVEAAATDLAGNFSIPSSIDSAQLTVLPTTSSIAGTLYFDRNNSGAQDSGEPAFPGVTVYLDANDNGGLEWTDGNGNGLWDAGEGERWIATDGSGGYLFDGLSPGKYVVRSLLPSGFDQIAPTADAISHQQINQPGPVPFDYFGDDIAIHGDLVIIGAPGDLINSLPNNGSIHIYQIVDGSLVYQQTITTPVSGTLDADRFGDAFATNGEHIIVGSPLRWRDRRGLFP